MKKNLPLIIEGVVALLSILGVILYAINFASDGYFHGKEVPAAVVLTIVAVILTAAIVASRFLKLEGLVAKIVECVVLVLKAAVPVALMGAALALLSTRIEGFGYIYFANSDVALEVATPENLASAGLAVANIVVYAVASLGGMVSAFFKD